MVMAVVVVMVVVVAAVVITGPFKMLQVAST